VAYERSETYTNQFGAYVRGIPVRQAVAILSPTQVAALRGTPATIVESSRVPAGAVVIPVRAALFKPSGDAYVVPNTTNFKLRWIGVTTQDLFHLEVDPVTLGAGVGLDQTGEFAGAYMGPSFSFSGASQVLVTKTAAFAAEGRGIELYNVHATTDISSVGVPLQVWVWYHELPVRG